MGLERSYTRKNGGNISHNDKRTRIAQTNGTSHSFQGFKRGQVVSFKLKNFVTFDEVSLQASPSLNLIAAPNGTGKSTIASALAIVLCSNLRNLDRASSLSEFVKRGKERATIEISLYDPQLSETNFQRKISRSFDIYGKSESFVDDRPVRQSEVLDLCKSYNIQLDNLCVFMPQDRIASFTSMDAKELFQRTLEAVGDTDLHLSFNSLVSKENELKTKKLVKEADENRLAQLKKEHERLETSRQHIEEVQRLENELKRMEIWKQYLLYNEKRTHLLDILKKKKELRNNKVVLQNECKRVKEEIEKAQNELEARTSELQSLHQAAHERKEKIRFRRNILEEAFKAIKSTMESQKKLPSYESLRKSIEMKREKIASLEQRLSGHNDLEELERLLKERREQLSELKSKHDEEQNKLYSKTTEFERAKNELQRQIQESQQLDNYRIRQLTYLEERNPGIQQAVKLIEQNSHHLRGRVWGPIGLEFHPHDEYAARILQACVPNSLRRMFVVEYDEDLKLLTESICKDVPFDCVSIAQVSEERLLPPSDLESLRCFGLYDVVTNIFDAPREIKLAMCSHTPYSWIYVGNKTCEEHTEEICEKTNVRHWFNPKEYFRVTVSRFTKEKILQREPLRPLAHNFLLENKDKRSRSSKIDDLTNKKNQIEEELASQSRKVQQVMESMQQCESRIAAVSSERNEVFKLLSERKKLVVQVEKEEAELEKFNLQEERLKFRGMIERQQRDIVLNLKELQVLVKDCMEVEKQLDQAVVSRENYNISLKLLESEATERYEEFLTAQNEYIAVKSDYVHKKNELEQLWKELEENHSEEHYKSLKTEFPQDWESFHNLYNQRKAKWTAISNVDPLALSNYERVEEELAQVETRLQKTISTLVEEEKRFLEERDEFIDKMSNQIASMNERFSQLFSLLECRGQLVLKNVEDLKNLSIEINVSFRDDQPLLPLSGLRNSGGEKMVSIMLYLFSMQQSMKAPFTLVDEMNQGMDPTFERKIVSVMISDARHSTSSQVFLISPKLLTDLEFGRETKTHFIFNGPCVSTKQDCWNQLLSKYIEG
ncbi:hypothetical protein GAYE_SCF64G6692 [Galdieria yellowstonensis]|uniref:Structural maintenance of chromosomes protein 5 n=1 Tax=Galdieria yellowstonensis TaxID=3028027 RepID=A0AAV9IMW3_9RHOD|nr:hypothetical protein GAYE_SCF64G6692 [Galdieria yellowstonensis]